MINPAAPPPDADSTYEVEHFQRHVLKELTERRLVDNAGRAINRGLTQAAVDETAVQLALSLLTARFTLAAARRRTGPVDRAAQADPHEPAAGHLGEHMARVVANPAKDCRTCQEAAAQEDRYEAWWRSHPANTPLPEDMYTALGTSRSHTRACIELRLRRATAEIGAMPMTAIWRALPGRAAPAPVVGPSMVMPDGSTVHGRSNVHDQVVEQFKDRFRFRDKQERLAAAAGTPPPPARAVEGEPFHESQAGEWPERALPALAGPAGAGAGAENGIPAPDWTQSDHDRGMQRALRGDKSPSLLGIRNSDIRLAGGAYNAASTALLSACRTGGVYPRIYGAVLLRIAVKPRQDNTRLKNLRPISAVSRPASVLLSADREGLARFTAAANLPDRDVAAGIGADMCVAALLDSAALFVHSGTDVQLIIEDISRCYDEVQRSDLGRTLKGAGVPKEAWSAIMAHYSHTVVRIATDFGISALARVLVGLTQGDPISNDLLAIITSYIIAELRRDQGSFPQMTLPRCTPGEAPAPPLIFIAWVDDNTHIAPAPPIDEVPPAPTASGETPRARAVCRAFARFGLRAGTLPSGAPERGTITLRAGPLGPHDPKDDAELLGIMLTASGGLAKHVAHRCAAAGRAHAALFCRGIHCRSRYSVAFQLHINETCVNSSLFYGASLLGAVTRAQFAPARDFLRGRYASALGIWMPLRRRTAPGAPGWGPHRAHSTAVLCMETGQPPLPSIVLRARLTLAMHTFRARMVAPKFRWFEIARNLWHARAASLLGEEVYQNPAASIAGGLFDLCFSLGLPDEVLKQEVKWSTARWRDFIETCVAESRANELEEAIGRRGADWRAQAYLARMGPTARTTPPAYISWEGLPPIGRWQYALMRMLQSEIGTHLRAPGSSAVRCGRCTLNTPDDEAHFFLECQDPAELLPRARAHIDRAVALLAAPARAAWHAAAPQARVAILLDWRAHLGGLPALTPADRAAIQRATITALAAAAPALPTTKAARARLAALTERARRRAAAAGAAGGPHGVQGGTEDDAMGAEAEAAEMAAGLGQDGEDGAEDAPMEDGELAAFESGEAESDLDSDMDDRGEHDGENEDVIDRAFRLFAEGGLDADDEDSGEEEH